jgi:hypothetical protein
MPIARVNINNTPPAFGWKKSGSVEKTATVKHLKKALPFEDFSLMIKAKYMEKAGARASRGWNEKPPTLSQRLAPPTLLPIPGNKVAHVAANASNHKTGAIFLHICSGTE